MEQGLKIFISYAHRDAALREELDKHLSQLKRQKFIDVWHHRDISAGIEWQSEVDAHLNTAQIILLLISSDFMASNYCFSIEMERALERHKRGEALVVPILLRPADWQHPPLDELQVLPKDTRPVTNWRNRDDAFLDIVIELKKAIEKINRKEAPIGTYTHSWNTTQPGCLIFLLDQSLAMSRPFGLARPGVSERKSDVAARVINKFLNELIVGSTIPRAYGDAEVKAWAEVAILGYGHGTVQSLLPGMLASRTFVSLPELSMNPLATEKRIGKATDDTGRWIEVPIPFPIWVKLAAEGSAPLCAALEFTQALAEQWANAHPFSYPPVVIHIAGGTGDDGDPVELIHKFRQVNTTDGHALLFNICISSLNHPPLAYPATETAIPNDPDAKRLFSMSSIIPESNRALLQIIIGQKIPQGARGFIFNGDASSIRVMFNFASAPAHIKYDRDY